MRETLQYSLEGELQYQAVPRIAANELTLKAVSKDLSTLSSVSFRHIDYRNREARIALCEQIVTELIVLPRLADDEQIKLGDGGAVPADGFLAGKQAYLIVGLPASGKSSIAAYIADKKGAGILDSDFAKRKLPEFRCVSFGASLVHDESSEIVFGAPSKTRGYQSMLEVVAQAGMNLVIPKIGNDVEAVEDLAKTLKLYKYAVHLTLVDLPKAKATKRAISRFMETDRYVPLAMIHDSFGDLPSKTFLEVQKRNKSTKLFASFGVLNNDVDKGVLPKCMESTKNNAAELYKKARTK